MKIKREDFGTLSTGEKVSIYTISNDNMSFSVTDFGCVITSIIVPSKTGLKQDVVLGYSTLNGYTDHAGPFLGAFIGRFANRIGNASFTLNGKTYELDKNDNGNTLHGGFVGYDKMLFNSQKVKTYEGLGVRFTRTSPDGEQGFPGNVDIEVTYLLTNKNEIIIHYQAVTDKDTPINFTNHSYFNLTGNTKNTIFGHELMIDADSYLEVDDKLIPTGKKIDVAGTPFDFKKRKPVGQDFDKVKGGYDHNFNLNKKGEKEVSLCAEVYEPTSGRSMSVFTDQPGVQFYAGNSLNNESGRWGQVYRANTGMCLETQAFPDSPNKKDFPSCILKPGEEFVSTTIYAFKW